MPRCYIIPQPSPNAFATGRNPQHAAVAATEGHPADARATRNSRACIAHELAHVKHRDILISSVAATLAAADHDDLRGSRCSSAAAERRPRAAATRSRCIATMILAPIAAMLIQTAISRSREFDADAGGAPIAGSPDGPGRARCGRSRRRRNAVPLDANPATAHMFIIKPFSVRRVDERCSARIRRPRRASRRCSTLTRASQTGACRNCRSHRDAPAWPSPRRAERQAVPSEPLTASATARV